MITPMTSKLIPWRISQARRAFMAPVCIASDKRNGKYRGS